MKRKPQSLGSSQQRDDHSRSGSAPRRGALKRLVAGGAAVGVLAAIPSKWSRPVVEAVFLPAHAQTSSEADGDFFPEPDDPPIEVLEAGGDVSSLSTPPGWLEWLVPGARAGTEIPKLQCSHCGTCARIRDGLVTVTVTRYDNPNDIGVCYEATGGFGQTVAFSPAGQPSIICSAPTSVQLVRVEGAAPNRTLVISDGSAEFMLIEDPSRTCSCGGFACP